MTLEKVMVKQKQKMATVQLAGVVKVGEGWSRCTNRLGRSTAACTAGGLLRLHSRFTAVLQEIITAVAV